MSLVKKLLKLRYLHYNDDTIQNIIIDYLSKSGGEYYFAEGKVIVNFVMRVTEDGPKCYGYVKNNVFYVMDEKECFECRNGDYLANALSLAFKENREIEELCKDYIEGYEYSIDFIFEDFYITGKKSLLDKFMEMKDLRFDDIRFVRMVVDHVFVNGGCYLRGNIFDIYLKNIRER